MRKKYLSALLFGALLFASAGTFTSCKDYDDDINNLQSQIDANADAIETLQGLVDQGDYVTNVEKTAEGLVVTFKEAGSKTITLEDQVGSTVTVEDGVLYIDGVAQDLTVADPVEGQDQIIIENNMWSVLQEDGTYKSTGVPVSGVSVSGSEAEGYTFTIYTNGSAEPQVVKLPSAASLITSIDVAKVGEPAAFAITKGEFKKPSEWKGKKALPEDGAVIFTSGELNIRVNPVDAPATEVTYYLTNAKNKSLSNVTLSATSTDIGDNLTIEDAQGRASYNNNGLFTLAMDMKVLTKSEGEAFTKELKDEAKTGEESVNNRTAYAVNANSTARSAYSVYINATDAEKMEYVQIKGYEGDADKAGLVDPTETTPTAASITVNKDQVYTIENIADEVGTLYDLYFEVSEKDATNYGVKTDDLARTFQITKRPDVSTAANPLTLYVHTLDVLGNIKVAEYSISLSDAVGTEAEYQPVTFPLSTLTDGNANNDSFSIDINTMKEAMGDTSWQEWFNATDLDNTAITIHEKADASDAAVETISTAETTGADKEGLSYALLQADGKTAATDAADLASIKMNVTSDASVLKANKQYYAKVTFNNSSNAEVNHIIVPVTFVADQLSDLFEIASGFYNSELETITAYFRDATTPDTKVNLKDYFTKYVDDATVSALSTTNKVGETDKTENELFVIGGTGFANETLNFNSSTSYVDANGKPAGGYGQILNLKVTKDNFEGWKYNDENDGKYSFNIRLMSPIYEGAVNVVNNQITINGNDLLTGAKITEAMINGVDYNNNNYSLMPDEVTTTSTTWVHPQIADVDFDLTNAKYIKAIEPQGAVDATPTTPAQDGYFKVTGQPVEATATEVLPIKVEDKWGLVLEQDVTFTVTRSAE